MAPSENLCFFHWEVEDLYELYVKYSSILLTTTFVLSVIICVIGFVGNAIVIFAAVFIMKKHQSKIWFLNLAIADFVFLLCLPFHAVAYLNGNWPFGSAVCKVYNFLYAANMHASIFILAALSIDRSLAVANPIWHHKFFSQRARYCICFFIWSVTVLASVPALIFGAEIQHEEKIECSAFPVEDIEFEVMLQDFHHDGQKRFQSEMFNAFNHYLEKCQGYQCCATEKSLIIWNQILFSTKCLIIPLLVFSYFIPLCVILTSNLIIALKVKKSKSVKSSRLYRIIITVFIVHLLNWTPVFVVLIIILVAVQNMNIIYLYKVAMFLPLLSTISFTSNCLNPIMYVLVGSQVRSEFTGFIDRVRSSLSYHS